MKWEDCHSAQPHPRLQCPAPQGTQANKTDAKPSARMPHGSDIKSRLWARPQPGFHSQGPQHSEWPRGRPLEGHSSPQLRRPGWASPQLSGPCFRQVGRLESAPGHPASLQEETGFLPLTVSVLTGAHGSPRRIPDSSAALLTQRFCQC